MAETVFDLTRRALDESSKCNCPAEGNAACVGVLEPPASCLVGQLAHIQDLLFAHKYRVDFKTPAEARRAEVADIEEDVKHLEGQVAAAFPDCCAAPGAGKPTVRGSDFQYWKMQRCLLFPDGTKAPGGQRYVSRETLKAQLRYAPKPLIHVKALDGKLAPQYTDLVPIMADRVMNPELVLVVILLVLIGVVWGLLSSVSKWKRAKYFQGIRDRDAAIEAAEAADPWRYETGTPSFTVDPNDKWRLLVPQYEAQGYCMKEYRRKLGMPEGPDC